MEKNIKQESTLFFILEHLKIITLIRNSLSCVRLDLLDILIRYLPNPDKISNYYINKIQTVMCWADIDETKNAWIQSIHI